MTIIETAPGRYLLGDELIVFTDASTKGISVLYRRKDGNYGLIETARSGPAA